MSKIARIGARPSKFLLRSTVQIRNQSQAATVEAPPDTIRIVPSLSNLTKPDRFESDLLTSLVRHLQSRYLIEGSTHEELFHLSEPGKSGQLKLYCGADPSAKSLHIGNLLPFMVMLHFRLRGYDVVGLIGGATGAVGDPSGRSKERAQIESDERADNVARIELQIRQFLNNGVEYARSRNYPFPGDVGKSVVRNNADWWKSIGMLDFLAKYGRHIRVTNMLARDSIQSRLSSQGGLGFNEFTYQVLQAYDFWELYKTEGVNLQIGGNDQWGNITAGIDLISRLHKLEPQTKERKDKNAYGITVPLLTTPSGEKFGKSAGNAVFIDPSITSPYQLYQYFIQTPDEIVGKLLKVFTLLPLHSVDEHILPDHEKDPGSRIAQRVLAREVVDLVHGVGVGDQMAYITSFLFPTPDQPFDDEISAAKLIENFKRSGILVHLDSTQVKFNDLKMSTLLSKVMNKSKTETKNLIKNGGIYLGLEREQLQDPDDVVLFDKENHLIDNKLLLVRSGKQNYYVVVIEDSD